MTYLYSKENFENIMLKNTCSNGETISTISINRKNQSNKIYIKGSITGLLIPTVWRGYFEDGIYKQRSRTYQTLDENISEFNMRLQNNVEVNIYRVVQEAINNALKYSKSKYILITLDHTDSYLKIKVKDDGIGFDPTEKNSYEGTGNGLIFMKERVGYIDGELRISSEKGQGTTVHIVVPI